MRTMHSHIRTIIGIMQDCKNKFLKSIAKIVRKHRADVSISQLSNEIGLSKSIWSELEKGRKDIQLTTFWRIAAVSYKQLRAN